MLTIFSRIIERQMAARHSAEVFANVSASNVLDQEQFRSAMLDLLERKSADHRVQGDKPGHEVAVRIVVRLPTRRR